MPALEILAAVLTLLAAPAFAQQRPPAWAPPMQTPARPAFQCDGRRYCREMRSCEEAFFFLRVCGVTRLDGDGDGVPCETLCGGGRRRR